MLAAGLPYSATRSARPAAEHRGSPSRGPLDVIEPGGWNASRPASFRQVSEFPEGKPGLALIDHHVSFGPDLARAPFSIRSSEEGEKSRTATGQRRTRAGMRRPANPKFPRPSDGARFILEPSDKHVPQKHSLVPRSTSTPAEMRARSPIPGPLYPQC